MRSAEAWFEYHFNKQLEYSFYAYKSIYSILDDIMNWVKDIANKLWTLLKPAIDKAVEWLWGVISPVLEEIKNMFGWTIEQLKPYFEGISNWIAKNVLDPWSDWLKSIFGTWEKIYNFFAQTLPGLFNNIIGAIQNAYNWLANEVPKFFGWIIDIWNKIYGFFTQTLPTFFGNVVDALNALYNWLTKDVTAFFNAVVNFLKDPWTNLYNAIVKPLQDFGKWLWDGIVYWGTKITDFLKRNVLDPIISALSWLADWAKDIIRNAFDAIEKWMGTASPIRPEEAWGRAILLSLPLVGAASSAYLLATAGEILPLFRGANLTRLAAWISRMIGPQVIIGAMIGSMATVAITTPLRHYFNSMFRTAQLSEDVLRTAYLRGIISEADYRRGMAYHGFSDDKIDIIKECYKWIPGPTDIISIAVREGFDEGVVRERTTGPNAAPQAYYDWLAKQGATREWADRFWAIHWVLPSMRDLYEMFHRGVIDEATLRQFLKWHDYLPSWHEWFIKIAYRPYSRVDARRMYAAGVLNEQQLKRAYMDLGYDEEHAENLVKWTKAQTVQKGKDLTLSQITKAYKIGNITKDECIDMLMDLGYDESEAEFIADTIKVEAEVEQRDLTLSQLSTLYRYGIINEDEFRRRLLAEGYTAEAINNIVQLEKIKAFEKLQRLPLGTLREALRRGVIDEEEFRRRARLLGYPDDDIDIVIALEAARAAA
jgi:uncharacterized membrane protein